MTRVELLNRIWEERGDISSQWPENHTVYKLTRNGAKVVSSRMAENGENVPAAALRDCFWSYRDVIWNGVLNFRIAEVEDYRHDIKHRRNGWYMKHPSVDGEWIFLGE